MPQPFRLPVPTAWRVGGLLEQIRNLQKRLKSLPLLGIKPMTTLSLVTIVTELHPYNVQHMFY